MFLQRFFSTAVVVGPNWKRWLLVAGIGLMPPNSSEASLIGSGTAEIFGTFSFDFERGVVTSDPGRDIWWQQITETNRAITPRESSGILALGMMEFSSITETDLLGYPYDFTPIQGPPISSLLDQGSVFAVRTTEGHYAKAEVTEYSSGGFDGGVNRRFYDMHIRYELYEPIFGDTLPLDGSINIDDLNNIRNHFGDGVPLGPPIPGDSFPFDGIVNIDDLNRVRNNFGAGTNNVVPEPAGWALAVMGFGALALRRGRRDES